MLDTLRNVGLRTGFLIFGIFLLGLLMGWFLSGRYTATQSYYFPRREENTEFKFIKPLLFVNVGEELAFPRFSGLKRAMTEYVKENETRPDVDHISVYFRNLNSSQWTAVNVEERFEPASMLKVITLMTVLRAAVDDPTLLEKKIRLGDVEGGIPTESTIYPPSQPALPGQMYTVEGLLKQLIVESDNGAHYALSRLMGKERIQDTYDDLQLSRLDDPHFTGYTAQEYSRVFRALYNGTYLPHYLSEQALHLLSTTKFTQGIVAGVPEGTLVSHKFGIRGVADSESDLAEGAYQYYELHDCGIVYYPEEPYFLCVMTRGSHLETLELVIQEVSRLVWEEVGRVYESSSISGEINI